MMGEYDIAWEKIIKDATGCVINHRQCVMVLTGCSVVCAADGFWLFGVAACWVVFTRTFFWGEMGQHESTAQIVPTNHI